MDITKLYNIYKVKCQITIGQNNNKIILIGTHYNSKQKYYKNIVRFFFSLRISQIFFLRTRISQF